MGKEEALRKFGLGEDEANAYLNLLRLGSIKVNVLAKKLSLPRTSVYNILNCLLSRGLASYTIKSGVRYYEAADPRVFLSQLKEKKENI